MDDQKLINLFKTHVENQKSPTTAEAKKLWDQFQLEQEKGREFQHQKRSQTIIWIANGIILGGLLLLFRWFNLDYVDTLTNLPNTIDISIAPTPIFWVLMISIIVIFTGYLIREAFGRNSDFRTE